MSNSITITLITIALSCSIITVITVCQILNRLDNIEQMLIDARDKIRDLYKEE